MISSLLLFCPFGLLSCMLLVNEFQEVCTCYWTNSLAQMIRRQPRLIFKNRSTYTKFKPSIKIQNLTSFQSDDIRYFWNIEDTNGEKMAKNVLNLKYCGRMCGLVGYIVSI